MHYGVTLTFDLNELDDKTFDLYDEGYHDKIAAIENDLYKLDGVEQVMFNHMSWIKVNFGDFGLYEVQKQVEVLEKEIKDIFAKHGVTI